MTTTMTAPGPVLVGVDGSTQNTSAVAWAAAEASASEGLAPLVLVHDAETAGRSAGRAILERATVGATGVDPRLRPSGDLVAGGPTASLLGSAHTWEQTWEREPGSSLLVVGRRGQGANRRISLGSTARTLVHQDGPTLVVVPDDWAPGQVAPDAPVVVDVGTLSEGFVGEDAVGEGTVGEDAVGEDSVGEDAVGEDSAPAGHPHDGTAGERALTLALDRARREERPVLAVASWTVPVAAAGQVRSIREVWDEHADRAEQSLATKLAPWRSLYPDVALTGVATDRSPVLALLSHAEGAEILVVPRGPRASAVVEYADGPVAVV